MKTSIECATMAQLLHELKPKLKFDHHRIEVDAAEETLRKNYNEQQVYEQFASEREEESSALLMLEWKNGDWPDEEILSNWPLKKRSTTMSIKLGTIVRTKRHSHKGIVKGISFLFQQEVDWVEKQKQFGNFPKDVSSNMICYEILCAPNGSVTTIATDVEIDEDKDGAILAQLKEQNKWYSFYF